MIEKTNLKIAVFFDAENLNPKSIPGIINELENHGIILYQRAYADWSMKNMTGSEWRNLISKTPITVYQQFHIKEKQVIDKTIIMDAVELAIKHDDFDTIAIISSDNGFYSLALRLRELGKWVIGIGEKEKLERGNSNNSLFVKSCNEFQYIEEIKEIDENILPSDKEFASIAIQKVLEQAYELSPKRNDENGEYVLVSAIGEKIQKVNPDFNYKKEYGKTLLEILKDHDEIFEIFKDSNKTVPTFFVRKKRKGIEKGQKEEGTIKRIINGYGIITNETGDYFFAFTDISNMDKENKPRKNMRVYFTAAKKPNSGGSDSTEKNGKATDVELLPEA